MLKLARYLRGYVAQCVLAPLFKLLEAVFNLLVPFVMASVVDEGIAQGDRAHILLCAALLVGMGVVGLACAATAQYFSARLGAGFGRALRRDLFSHVMRLSRADLDALGPSTLVTRLTNDANQVQDGVNLFFRLVLRSPLTVFGAAALSFVADGVEGLLFCVVIAVVLLFVWLVMRVAVRRYRAVQGRLDTVLMRASEQLEGVRVVRAFGREARECDEFDDVARGLRREQVGVGDVSALMNPLTYAAVNLGLVAILWLGGFQVDLGNLTQGELVALVSYAAQMLVELLKLANLVVVLSRASACARRVNEVFARKSSMADGTLDASGAPASLELSDVSFTYPGAAAPALSHVSLSVAPGEVLGVIGGTGSGKSTLAALVRRAYDATEGTVRVGGRDVRDWTLASLRRLVAIVNQRPRLFSGTIGSNLRMAAPDASDEELMACVRDAQAQDVVEGREQGLEARVEQGGRNLSGGQRQRLAIARALARGGRLLVLDDASSALDFATDARLRHALRKRAAGHVTTVLVSQRVSALKGADRICVLDAGRLVGLGTHEELLRSCEVYREICESQLEGVAA